MSTAGLTAANVMDATASLMNDTARSVYHYEAQMPYLNMALRELQEHFQLNNIPITDQTSAAMTLPVGTTEIGSFEETPALYYPQDLIEIQGAYERLSGSTNPWIPMLKREFLPHAIDDIPTDALQYWIWQDQKMKFIGATSIRSIKLDYIRSLFPQVTNQAALLGVIGAASFLQYRTAALCSLYIGENASRAESLDGFAQIALDRVTGIGTKAKQSITTRRKPFMSAYKRRSFT
ncbi:MAG: hypothetical protein ABWY25_10160 [Paenisporosarcina sp.]